VTAAIVKGLFGAGVVFAAALAALQLGLGRPSASDRLGARIVAALDHTRGRGAEITIGGSRLHAECRRTPRAGTRVRIGGSTEIVAVGAHVVARRWLGSGRTLSSLRAPDLPSAELELAGSHDVYARELGGRLQRGSVPVAAERYRGRPAYRVLLHPGNPLVELVVDARSLRPVAARYRSGDLTASSTLVAARHGSVRGC
jgi:hypothetical protein